MALERAPTEADVLPELSHNCGERCRLSVLRLSTPASGARTSRRNNYVHRVSDPNLAEHAGSSFYCVYVATTATGELSGRVDF